MNWNKLLILGSMVLVTFAVSTANAQQQMHRTSGPRAPATVSGPMGAPTMASRHPGDGHHHFDGRFRRFNNFVFFDFGFPFYYPYPYYGYYPYGYYAPPVYQGYASPVYQGQGYGDASLVLQVQRRLARAGYYHGAIDGVIGSGTRRAIRGYERAHGLPVDGRIDPALLSTMGLA
jgi:hypothetical protein